MRPPIASHPEDRDRPVVWHCSACRKRNETTLDHCIYCNAPKPAIASKPATASAVPSQQLPDELPSPGLATMFRFLAVLEIIGGFVLCCLLWPGETGSGYDWRTIAYVRALTWLLAGLIFGCLFWAVADVLKYLCHIRDSLTRPKV